MRGSRFLDDDDDRTDAGLFAARARGEMPFAFVLDELAQLEPYTRPMFGCRAVYVGERIVMILRDRPTAPEDNGVWLATSREHHASLAQEFAAMRSIGVLGPGTTGWQLLPKDSDDFERAVLRACALVRAGDARIGKVPKGRRRPAGRAAASKPAAKRASQPAAKGAAKRASKPAVKRASKPAVKRGAKRAR